ncbi:hypothetical protein BDZ89DRAFT_1084220 [Hymenopellis radicata]|nr:hypothetical protein BDZ89DRAFT_1084220 [Hymenopellis radicata]
MIYITTYCPHRGSTSLFYNAHSIRLILPHRCIGFHIYLPISVMILVAREYLRNFLSDQIAAYDPSEPHPPNMHPSRPTSWPDGPDYDFPWTNPRDECAFQVLEIGGGYRVLLRRTRATLGNGERLDDYAWSIYLLDVHSRPTFCESSANPFPCPDIQNLFNWTSAHRDRLWVLELLRISLERGYTIHALHLPVLVPGTWGHGAQEEGEEQLYHAEGR